MVTILLCAAVIVAVSLLAWCWQPVPQEEPMEFSATYDAIAAERAQVDAIKRKSHANERLIVAEAMAAKLGRPHDPVEL